MFAETHIGNVRLRASVVVEVAGHDLDRLNLRLMAPFAITGSVVLPRTEGAKPEER